MARAVLIGGPLDSVTVVPHALSFIYVGGTAAAPRVHAGPGRGRLLYRLVGPDYLFAGDTHRLCAECAMPQPRGEVCAACGGKLIPA